MTLNGSVGFVQIGPEYEANRTHTLCISMHVAACQRCEFHLQLMNETNHIVSNVVRVQVSNTIMTYFNQANTTQYPWTNIIIRTCTILQQIKITKQFVMKRYFVNDLM